jgi:hypothetical protein
MMDLDDVELERSAEEEKAEQSEPNLRAQVPNDLANDGLAQALVDRIKAANTGVLFVAAGTTRGQVYLRAGEVIHAAIEGRDGLSATDALREMLRWTQGSLRFETQLNLPAGVQGVAIDVGPLIEAQAGGLWSRIKRFFGAGQPEPPSSGRGDFWK